MNYKFPDFKVEIVNPTITGNSILTTNTNLNTLKTTPAGLGTKNYVLKGEYDTSYYIVVIKIWKFALCYYNA